MKVVVTIPAYNEVKTIAQVIHDIKSIMNNTKYKYEIIVVNDGSLDNTAEVAKKAGAIVYSHPQNLGLAETFRTEIAKCLKHKADIIVHTDADGQYLAKDIPKLISYVEEGYDFVLGSRFMGKIERMPIIKRLGNRAFSNVISKITKKKITDGQSGFRVFTKEIAELPITSNHTYTQEQIIRTIRNKFKLIEVPVYFAKRHGKTKSRLMKNPFDYAIKAWINLIRVYRDYEPLKFFGRISVLLFLMSIALFIFVIIKFIQFGQMQLDKMLPSIILATLFFLTALQILLFGFLADMKSR